jgi:hypothetical protein
VSEERRRVAKGSEGSEDDGLRVVEGAPGFIFFL